jgi:hypothetical protein
LVAKAATLAAQVNITNPSGPAGSGGLAGGSSESAGSIGFRDHTVQMLRDGYYRLCEAYLNGALSEEQYSRMILNADTFMVIVSALQILGSNPVAPAVIVTPGGLKASVSKDGEVKVENEAPPKNEPKDASQGKPASDANAHAAEEIVKAYLSYRYNLARYLERPARSKRTLSK